jgi:predicted nucleic acid-binding protein
VKVLFDTSTLVAAMVAGHPAHAAALPRLLRVKDRVDAGFVAAHSLAELYATLSRLPVNPRISPTLALQLIQHNVIDICQIIALSADDYVHLLNHLASLEIVGGVIYDALLLHAAWLSSAEQVVTLNPRDFRRAYPQLADKIVSPLEQ